MTVKQMRQRMYVDGWCLIEDVIPPAEIGAVHDSVLRTVDTYKHTRKNAPANIGAVSGMIVYDQSFAPYLAEPRLLGLAESLLGTDLRISFNSSIVNYPGNERSRWHADWPFNQQNAGHIRAPYPDAVCHLTTLWMLTEFTAENGGTLIVSGSHRSNDNPSGGVEVPPFEPYPTEVCVTGPARLRGGVRQPALARRRRQSVDGAARRAGGALRPLVAEPGGAAVGVARPPADPGRQSRA